MDFEADYRFVFHDHLQMRFSFAPVCGLLISVGDSKNSRLVEMFADDLHADGQSFGIKPTSQREGWQACEIHGDCVDVRKVHLQWVLGLLADLKGGCWRCRSDDRVAALQGFVKVLFYQCPHFLGFQIVSVILSGGERVRAEHDPSFDLRSESLGTTRRVGFGKIFGAGAMAISHSIVARQIGTRLGSRDDIIDGHRVFRVRQRNINYGRAVPLELTDRLANCLLHSRLYPRDKILFWNTYPQTLDVSG